MMYTSISQIVKAVLQLIVVFILSWLLIHVFAVFGVFFAIAYPVWWLLRINRLRCPVCHFRKSEECTFSHAIYSTLIYLFLTGLSVGLVIGEQKIIRLINNKTVSFVLPDKSQHRIGELFEMEIKVKGLKVPINVVQADLQYDPARVEIKEISTKNSFANVFLQKEINNNVGYARIVGGKPNPGFLDNEGFFAKVYLRAKKSGFVQISYLPSSLVLANDGFGSNLLVDFGTANFVILPSEGVEETSIDSSILLESVLGETSDKSQMIFYEEGDVLSESVDNSLTTVKAPNQQRNLWMNIINVIETVDHLILNSWEKVWVFIMGIFRS